MTGNTEQERYVELLQSELSRFVAHLRSIGASKIVLFGSYAEGRKDLYTDLDLFVVLESNLPFVERTAWLYKELAPRVLAIYRLHTSRVGKHGEAPLRSRCDAERSGLKEKDRS